MAMVFKMRPVALGSEYALGRRNHAFAAGIKLQGHAQGAAEGFEDGLALVVCVFALEVVAVQGDQGMVGKALEELARQVDIEAAGVRAGEGHVVEELAAPGKVSDPPRDGLIACSVS